ncbi:hypothetical protein V5799_020662 [Amblyomma americanum]|uniref:Immunoglobulin G binding protein A n=1 Tax=Amblyomma americanum TaxID=6943 RepID=A0AAQ4ETF8_AMBAM
MTATMRLLAVLPVATALLLWAAVDTCLGRRITKASSDPTSCPAICAKRAFFIAQNGTSVSMQPQEILVVESVQKILMTIKGGEKWVTITVGGDKVHVPSRAQIQIRVILQKNPQIRALLIGFIEGKRVQLKQGLVATKTPVKRNPPKKPAPPTKRPTAKPKTTPKATKNNQRTKKPATKRTKPTKKGNVKTTKRVPAKSTRRLTTKATKKPVTKTTKKPSTKPTRKSTSKLKSKPPKGVTPKPSQKSVTRRQLQGSIHFNASFEFWKNFRSNMPMPDISRIGLMYINAVPNIDPKALILLGYLFSQPNYFSVVYQTLIQIGIKFPSLTGPINSVTWNNVLIPFPQPLVVSYIVNVKGGVFQVPREAPKLALYLSTHAAEIAGVASSLSRIGGMYSISGGNQITGFTIFGQFYRFTKPAVTTLVLNGRSYVLPKDIDAILVAVKSNYKLFYSLQMLLEAFGVQFKKANPAVMQGLTPQGKSHSINIVPGVRIKIDDKFYDIPADLEAIFKKSDGFKVGALLAALQEKGVPVKVDEKTGVIEGILIKDGLVPFPYTIDLRFKMDNTVYVIPRDLQKLIAVLEKKNMPSKILSILYDRYGVIPVRNADNTVIAISFNGKKYPVKAQPQTAVTIRGRKFLLPKDTAKLVDFVQSLKNDDKIGFEFLKALKVAGFMLVTDDDGAMRRIQKGAQLIKLGMEIRVRVIYDKKTYKVPQDLMLLVNLIRKSGPAHVKKVTDQLKAFDVEVTKKDKKLKIVFNSVQYVVDLQSGSVQG